MTKSRQSSTASSSAAAAASADVVESIGPPGLKILDPAAAQWIGALIRVTAGHPAITRALDLIERLQEQPYRTNFVLLGEPGTGKEGLARAFHHLTTPSDAPLVRFDVAGFPEDAALEVLFGAGNTPGAAEAAHGGTLLIEEVAGLGPRVQLALLRLLKAGKFERIGDNKTRRVSVHAIALSDVDLAAEVAAGRMRHDLYYRLARVVLWLPPLRERLEDLEPAAVWMGNRILRDAGARYELRSTSQMKTASEFERSHTIELTADAVTALREHSWTGNFRELEAVLERALLIYRRGLSLGAEQIEAALARPDGKLTNGG